ncbi:hypothetical protein [Janthinobacterium sp. PAMC25594]|uniref:hypothetical protein n=1 Tax=Janthinobacterium sp. PAMC25594 TaxID=2861284 RepID=UPI001C62B765|nr:hypothetical protein [Janthinobacterium sp. PAMC25594]QYG06253.1 hypothetical protein KY494_23760 [Janthinobacterium sp. PAMC25594]
MSKKVLQNQAGSGRGASKKSGASGGNFSRKQTASERENKKASGPRAGQTVKKNPCLALGDFKKRRASERKNKRWSESRASQGAGNFSRFAAKNSNIEKKPVRGEKVKNAGTEKNAGHFRAMPRSRDTSQKRPAQIQKLILMHITNLSVKSKSDPKSKSGDTLHAPACSRQTRSRASYSPKCAPVCARILR